jgi:histone-lysine N-methyltransferase SETD3
MLFMLLDRCNPNSFFKPYYDILPRTLSNMPIFWTPEELQWLEGSYMLQQIEERKGAIESDYRGICEIAPEFAQTATLEEFSWSRMCVCSRNFGLTVNGVRTAALVPYADMLNHYRPRETKWEFDDTCQGFIITSLQKINAGAQVYDSYGQKCNHRFLLNYGFSIENNIESDGTCPNEVPLLIQLSVSDQLYDRKVALYGGDNSLPMKRIRVCVSENESTKTLFALLRIIAADETDINLLTSGSGSSYFRSIREANFPISLRNERAMMTLLQNVIQEHLARYPATLQEDIDLLKSATLAPFSNQRHAVIQVQITRIEHLRAPEFFFASG